MDTAVKTDIERDKPYGIGLDILRILAMLLVITVHSTTFYGFTAEGIVSWTSVLVGAGRYLSFACVPLFILLSGYLCLYKKPELSYYLKLAKIFIEFGLAALAVALFYSLSGQSAEPLAAMMERASRFLFPTYSWYIRMYIGLFLLAPFFNYIIRAISGRQAVLLVVASLLVFSQPFVTDYWQAAYPLMYYLIGGVIRKTQFRVKKRYCIAAVLLFSFLGVVLLRYPVIPNFYIETHNNLFCVIISVGLFLMLYPITSTRRTRGKRALCRFTRTVANTSMACYLVSEIFEVMTANLFARLALYTFSAKLPYLLYLTPIKFLLSIVLGLVITMLTACLYRLILLLVGIPRRLFRRRPQE